jgi:hypothetical protein
MAFVLPEILEQQISTARQKLCESIETQSAVPPSQWEVTVSVGEPVSLILEQAQQHSADLLVVGSHGRQGLQQLLLGSVAESVLSHAKCPVLIVGPQCRIPTKAWQTILFASDLDQTGIPPAEYAASLSLAEGSKLLLLHVSPENRTQKTACASGLRIASAKG